MKPIKMRLYPERSLYYLVLVWPDFKSMQARVDKYGGNNRRSFGGCTVTYKGKQRIIGEVNLYRGQLGVGLVAHELTHATWGWARRVNLEVAKRAGEERFCRVLQRMLNHYVARAWKLGLYQE